MTSGKSVGQVLVGAGARAVSGSKLSICLHPTQAPAAPPAGLQPARAGDGSPHANEAGGHFPGKTSQLAQRAMNPALSTSSRALYSPLRGGLGGLPGPSLMCFLVSTRYCPGLMRPLRQGRGSGRKGGLAVPLRPACSDRQAHCCLLGPHWLFLGTLGLVLGKLPRGSHGGWAMGNQLPGSCEGKGCPLREWGTL